MELLVALTVLATGILAVAGIGSVSQRLVSLALEETDATLLGAQALERTLADPGTGGVRRWTVDGRLYDVRTEIESRGGVTEIRASVTTVRTGRRRTLETIVAP